MNDVSLLEDIDAGTLVSVCGFKLGEALIIKRHAKRFADAENKEIDSCTKVSNGSYPLVEICVRTF